VSDLDKAIWAGDIDTLDRLAPCRCCCAEHTHKNCPAREWDGCRGFDDPYDPDIWFAFYARTRGMSWDEFYNTNH